jgi:TRAP-type C4-dicarboxylate transport system permease large subunit
MCGMVLFVVATASAFSWCLAVANVPQTIGSGLATFTHSPQIFLLASALALVVMGMLLEGLAALLIFGPLLLPLAPQFGVDPLQYGIVVIMAMGIGAFSPPIGVGAFVAAAITGTNIEAVMRRMLPYVVALLIGLVIIALVPSISLAVPHFVRAHTSSGP